MDKNLVYGAGGTFIGTILSMILISINPNPLLLIILPMWGLVMGVAIARVNK